MKPFRNATQYLWIVILSFYTDGLYAQKTKIDQTIPTHRWEIGVDVNPLFRDKIGFGFIVKRALHDTTKAIRFRADPIYSNMKDGTFSDFTGVKRINASFALGLEKRKQVGRFMLYYGSDLNFIYDLDVGQFAPNIITNTYPPTSLFKLYHRQIGGGVSAIMGSKYFINHRVSLSIETELMANYVWYRYEVGSVNFNNQPINVSVQTYSSINANFRGISSFFLSYHF